MNEFKEFLFLKDSGLDRIGTGILYIFFVQIKNASCYTLTS